MAVVIMNERQTEEVSQAVSDAATAMLSIAQLCCFDGANNRTEAIKALAQKAGWQLDHCLGEMKGMPQVCGPQFEDWVKSTIDGGE